MMVNLTQLRLLLALLLLGTQLELLLAFAVGPQRSRTPTSQSHTTLSAENSRRDFFDQLLTRSTIAASIAAAAAATVSIASSPLPAHASYSAYTHREEDWERRQKTGDIQVSNAKALRQQLREIAPMNNERSRVFCPNGTPSAVSPLMENKCNDQETAPSVFGRTEDVVGNSIPGFTSKSAASSYKYASSSVPSLEYMGGFPEYAKVSPTGGSR
ncbi:hypothetical protein MPSEU_000171700 [Mayamaea pseudoterrestris]|nr:hypothetical protein MPSEU_000171700 [Mayamaea pseudoterrestris]